MSLNFDLSKIVDDNPEGMQWVWPEYDAETNPAVPLNPKVESIIFATMNVGINKITHENAVEFYARYLMFKKAFGTPPYFNLSDILSTVGLSTNASSITRAAFRKGVIQHIEDEAFYAAKRDAKLLEDAAKESRNINEVTQYQNED